MTRDARYTVIVKRPFDVRVLRQRSREQGCGVVTRFAVACELNTFLVLQIFDVLLIERLTKSIAMCGLAPLRMRVRMTVSASLCRHKHVTRNERSSGRRGVPWR